jgi:hypothetical protein
MAKTADGHSDHRFVGVDVDLTLSAAEDPARYNSVAQLLSQSVILAWNTAEQPLPTTVSAGDTVHLPLQVTSLTAHALPSGVSFAREAWCELLVLTATGDTLYQSGVVATPQTPLDTSDPDLLLFTAYLLDENGEKITGVTDAFGIENRMLSAFGDRYHEYSFVVPAGVTGQLTVRARMLFRPFKPELLMGGHEDLLQNLPVFPMAEVSAVLNAG